MVRVTKTCQAIISLASLDATASQGVNLDCLSLTHSSAICAKMYVAEININVCYGYLNETLYLRVMSLLVVTVFSYL